MVVDVLRYHHEVDLVPEPHNLLLAVHAADTLATSQDKTDGQWGDLGAIHPAAVDLFSSQITTVDEWYPEVAEQIQEGCNFFL